MLEKLDTNKLEEKYTKKWDEEKTYKFKNDPNMKKYTIDTPPPFTSGELHMGHVLSYSFFDFAARYKRMNGYDVYYPQGWDTQGFPTEVKVEKKHGRLPPAEFRKKCVEWTEEMIKRMKSQMIEMGFSPDWDYEYKTMDPEYHKKVQLSLIRMYKDKYVYRAKHPVYWCPRCMSAIAKAETEEIEKSGKLNYIIFKGPEGEDLQIATTRPELMHACVAVMYHPEDKRYTHLKGKEITTALGKKVKAIPDKLVEKEFGTGLLMVCTFGDKDDVLWTHRYKLPIIEAIDERGKLINAGDLDGLKAEEAREKLIEKFKKEGKLVKQEDVKQAVKVHDRCKRPIELKSSLQWFADIKSHAKEIKEWASEIKWIPDFGIHYMTDWIENVDWDWVISRHRVFGTPLPFYVCEKCGYSEPAEESELPFYPESAKTKKCPKCKENLIPEQTVADCWVDSSITPLIIAGWPDENYKKLYPSDLRPQGVEIVRTWAFYTVYRSTVLTGKPPFKEILLNGNVLAPDGRKMSKSLGNIISPSELKKEYPVDSVRQWAALSGAMAKDRPFSYEDIRFSKSFINKYWNASRFIEKFLENYKHSKPEKLKLLDRWILTKLNGTIKSYTDSMENYQFHSALHKMHEFFWHDLCDNYLEYVKYRVYNDTEKQPALYSLYEVLYNSTKLLAPVMVFTTEEIYRELFHSPESGSIHNSRWPKPLKITELSEDELILMDEFNSIVSSARQFKASNRLSQNSELSSMKIYSEKEYPDELIDELKNILKVKIIKIEKGEFSVSMEI
ncbi:valine--tRNA ligase [Candidatus Micrarchaeota archaeon]|nr:valine--tRNA ligase [Candidatus Micrarchaeota archaeon]